MKWCFLVNNADFVSEFLGKIAVQALRNGDSCTVVFNSKIAEYKKKRFFPERAAFISKIDWCVLNYDQAKKEFGDFSWRDFLPIFERFKYYTFTYTKAVQAVSQLYQFFDWIMQTQKPDVFFGEPPAGLFGEIAYYFAKKYRIPFVGIGLSRFEGRLDMFSSECTDFRLQETFDRLQDADISKEEKELHNAWVQGFLSHKKLPSYARPEKKSFSQFELALHYARKIREEGKTFFRYGYERLKFQAYDYESEAIFWRGVFALWEGEKRQFRLWSQKNIFSSPKRNEKYFLFPLQVEPEASTLVIARYYANQLHAAYNSAFALPFPYALYVKEHPAAFGTRSRSFYRELKKIPQVVLISPDENVQELIKGSAGVITLTSTIGMESALAGKPVYLLGDVSYEYHPWCAKVKNFDELKEKINFDMQQPRDISKLNDSNMRFVASYLRNTVVGNMLEAGFASDSNNYEALYEYIARYALSIKTK